MATNITDDAKKPDAEETGRIRERGNYGQGNTGRYDNQQFDADGGTPRAGEDLPMAGGGYGQGMNTPGYDKDPEAADHVNAAVGGIVSADEEFDAGDATEASSEPNASTGSTTASGHGSGGRASGG